MSACISSRGEYSLHTCTTDPWTCDWCGSEDTDAMRREIERLRDWKASALEVMAGLQDVGKALGLPLGVSITGAQAVEAAERLKAERDAVVRPVETRTEWAVRAPAGYVSVRVDEADARDTTAQMGWPVLRRTVTIGPWEEA